MKIIGFNTGLRWIFRSPWTMIVLFYGDNGKHAFLQSQNIAGFYFLHLIASIIHCALQVSSSHHLHCFLPCSIARRLAANFVAPHLFRFALTSVLYSPLRRFSPVAVTRHRLCMLGHWSLSFQFSRWSIGFFHRVFAFVRVAQKLESFISPLYITKLNVLCSHFIRVVPSCFCQAVTISFICVTEDCCFKIWG
jgi:hypothetical protein